MEIYLDEEERSIEMRSFGESSIEEEEEPKSNGNNTPMTEFQPKRALSNSNPNG